MTLINVTVQDLAQIGEIIGKIGTLIAGLTAAGTSVYTLFKVKKVEAVAKDAVIQSESNGQQLKNLTGTVDGHMVTITTLMRAAGRAEGVIAGREGETGQPPERTQESTMDKVIANLGNTLPHKPGEPPPIPVQVTNFPETEEGKKPSDT